MSEDDLDELRKKTIRYCQRIAGSEWDAEDLAQETLIRLVRLKRENPDTAISNAFIFRIAHHLWVDRQRKKRVSEQPIDDARDVPEYSQRYDTRELLELLVERLPAKQVVVLLLMDVFDYTAKEVTGFIAGTENAILVTLHRARKTLEKWASTEESIESSNRKQKSDRFQQGALFEQLLHAFRQRSPKRIRQAYIDLLGEGIRVQRISLRDNRIVFLLSDPNGNLFRISTEQS
ncbi:RNA polymerase sigma factor [Cohnella sp. AR92]|uniref:RNA polymerase sigma factor n=1 Tax=Cohnella sp. AR92 TaxID=648716 RepID=UPI000F8EEB91|nr:RNA polymerase sigma factor [Cohnella sp. AR92]RUS47436.1 RNA polymerase sigma factor [Cohnella sp. AR92]